MNIKTASVESKLCLRVIWLIAGLIRNIEATSMRNVEKNQSRKTAFSINRNNNTKAIAPMHNGNAILCSFVAFFIFFP
jgi:hypothetical protein